MSESMFDKKIEIAMLYDFYGQLLTDKQKSVMNMYYNDDFSFAEIAEQLNISRQAVYDSAKNAERSLHFYEDKLGIVSRFMKTENIITRIEEELDNMSSDYKQDSQLVERLKKVKQIIKKID